MASIDVSDQIGEQIQAVEESIKLQLHDMSESLWGTFDNLRALMEQSTAEILQHELGTVKKELRRSTNANSNPNPNPNPD